MGFLGIGTGEILLILILALIILGPGKITEVARTLGKTVRAIRRASANLTTAVTRELEATQNEPPPSQLKEKNHVKTEEASSAVSKAKAPSRDGQPIKLEGHQQQNE
jgi:Sec-independent protein translocase protein TatA